MHVFHESLDERVTGCLRCARTREVHPQPPRPRLTVTIQGCEMCGHPFKVDREWLERQMALGAPAPHMCRFCHPWVHQGAPIV